VFGTLPRGLTNRIIRIWHPTFTVGTGVAISDGAGHVLLVTHSYSRGWSLPGGLLANTEVPAETARREVREELGLDLPIDGHPIAVRAPRRRHFTFLFTIEIEAVERSAMRGHTPEITDVDWFALDDLPELGEFTHYFLEAVGLQI